MLPVRLGFLPLTDCAVLVAARERGFAAAEQIDLSLVRDMSWATARDRLIYRQVDGAHLLAPLAIAVSLGLGQHQTALAAPFKLNLNGNQIVVSGAIAQALELPPAIRIADPAATVLALADILRRQPRRPIFGIVHRFSSHALILRYWLAYAGIDPDRDVSLRVLPPSFMVEALASGEIDGFCAGEPWGSAAVAAGIGQSVAASACIWQRGVEKVLALRQDWMEANPDTTDRLLRALDAAAAWCEAPANHPELAALLALPHYVDQPADVILRGLAGRLLVARGAPETAVPDFMMFHNGAANFPWRSQALWIYAQCLRWHLAEPSATAEQAAAAVFRPDIYRRALAQGRTPLPGANAKLEGALSGPITAGADRGHLMLGPDRFFDGAVFDPDQIVSYTNRRKL